MQEPGFAQPRKASWSLPQSSCHASGELDLCRCSAASSLSEATCVRGAGHALRKFDSLDHTQPAHSER